MIVHVRFLPMPRFLVILAEVVRMCQHIVIVVVRVPVGPMFPLVERIVRVVVGHVVMIVSMRLRRMSMLGLPTFAFSPLSSR